MTRIPYLGRKKGSTTKFHIGSIWGGCEIIENTKDTGHTERSVVLRCGVCGTVFEMNYPNFVHIVKHTDKITCGCASCEGIEKRKSTPKMQRYLESAALKAEVSVQKTTSNFKHIEDPMRAARDYALRLGANKEIAEEQIRAVLTTSMKPAQRDRIQKALNALGRIKV